MKKRDVGIYVRKEFEKWIKDRVQDGTFESEEEAYKVLSYVAWGLYTWAKQFGYRLFIREDAKPLTLDKIFELNGDIFDDEKFDKYLEEHKDTIAAKLFGRAVGNDGENNNN